jgi:hypothetical protein
MYTEKYIQARLWDHYFNEHKYMFHNIYFFNDLWECDAVHFLENGVCHEYEIKTKHFDYVDDFEKVKKHSMLPLGESCANKFFYVTPFDLVKKEELPPYAGLIEVSENRVRIKKSAPVLNKIIWNPYHRFDRFYKKLRNFVNEDFNKTLTSFSTTRKNKSAYKRKKNTPKPKHKEPDKILGNFEIEIDD